MSYSHKVSLQKLQLGPGMEVFGAGWLCGGGSVGPGSSGLGWTGRRWPVILLVSLSSKSCPYMKRFKHRRMFGNEQYVALPCARVVLEESSSHLRWECITRMC